jgi:hypothetical protein
VQLQFGPDDVNAFAGVKAQLIGEFRPWAELHYGADDGSLVADADTFLSWRFNYSNGDLTRFTTDDAEDFLFDWVPRKFAVGPDEAPVLCRAVQAMVEFLAVTGRLAGGVASAARVMMHVDDLVDDVADALADDTNFGIGKSLGAVALFDADGNLLPDLGALLGGGDLDTQQLQAALEQRMAAFNALPFEERRAYTDAAFAAREPEPVELAFTYVPPPIDEVERAAAESRLLRFVDGFVEFVATNGVKLTDAGNISLGDARKLVAVLDTGDVLDRGDAGRPVRTRSSTELRWLTLIDDVATYSGGVQRLRTKLVANEAWADTPLLERARAVVRGLLDAGPLQSRVAHWDDVNLAHRELLDDGIAHWVSQLLPEGSRLDYADVEELATEVTATRFPTARADWLLDSVPSRLSELFEVLEMAGVVTWHDRVDEHEPSGIWPAIVSGTLSLTPLGRFAMVEPVRDAGYVFPSIDDLATADGLTLVNAVGTRSVDEDGALAMWRADSSTADRARLLAAAAVAAEIPEQRLLAFHLLGRLDPLNEVGPVVRELLDTNCCGHAATFLLDHDLATYDEVGMFVDLGPVVDMLYTLIHDPADLDEVFRQTHAAAIDDLIEDMWRHDQPETIEVLEALGRHLSDKKLAKAARKAVIKHRSWLANEGR